MQLRIIAAAPIFIGSYFPLSLILLVQDINYTVFDSEKNFGVSELEIGTLLRNPSFSISIVVISLICFVFSIVVLRIAKPNISINLIEAKYIPADLMNYTLPYVASFMSYDYQEMGKFVGILLFLGWMFVISYQSGQVILNPLLIVFKWRVYELKYVFVGDDKQWTSQALSKDTLGPGMDCDQITVQDILVVKKLGDCTHDCT